MASLRPDVLVVQEVEPIAGELFFDGACQPTYRQRFASEGSRRGLGVFSYSGAAIRPAFDVTDPFHGFYPFDVQLDALSFQVVAVWTFATPTMPSRTYRQAHEGPVRYADWIRARPTVILGDFNNNGSYAKGKPWQQLVELLEPLGLVSAYHHVSGETYGQETTPTHFHKGVRTSPWHVDYCFVPADWSQRITRVEIGKYDDWRISSDHMPLIVDIDL